MAEKLDSGFHSMSKSKLKSESKSKLKQINISKYGHQVEESSSNKRDTQHIMYENRPAKKIGTLSFL